jgi:hypothetical protein
MAQSIEDNSMPLKEHQEYQEQQEQQHAFFRRLVNFVHQ